ncbi:MAG: Holliday junction branch migration protein RuvA [Bacillota bacterium]
MIDFVSGTVDHVDEQGVVVDTGGVGYRVLTADPYRFRVGQRVRVYTYHYIRDDQQVLYGFASRDERELFALLLQVSGVGPKGALAILAATAPEHLVNAIQREDERYLTRIPGIGPKTARRMILDLKDKVRGLGMPAASEGAAGWPNGQEAGMPVAEPASPFEEVRQALLALGYHEHEVREVLRTLRAEPVEDASTEALIRRALRKLAKV